MPSTVSVHRCRFVDYNPTALTAIAFPPLPLPNIKGKDKPPATSSVPYGTLAIARANGNIELHQWSGVDPQVPSHQAWVLHKVLPGPVPSKIDSLVFSLRRNNILPSGIDHLHELRLFSSGGGSEVLEWDLSSGTVLQSISSQGGSVWSMAVNPSSSLLALGCEDGSIRILSLADNSLTPIRRLERVKARLLSIAWGPPILQPHQPSKTAADDSSSDEDDTLGGGWKDSWIVAGCSDSSIHKFDVSSGRALHRMTMDKSRGNRTLVWAVDVIGDGTIISGDSTGTVKFWDSNTCTQLQSFKAHGADILCLSIGPDMNSVFTSGVDQRISQFSRVQIASATAQAPSKTQWVHSSAKRPHSHDVRALAIWPPHVPLSPAHRPSTLSTIVPLLVSGGLDMSAVVHPCALPSSAMGRKMINPLSFNSSVTFEDAYHQRIPYSTGLSPAIQVAPLAKLILCRRNTSLTLWKIKSNISTIPVEDVGHCPGDWERILEIELKVKTNLLASAISSDGVWIAAADLHETKLFRLVEEKSGLRPKRVQLPESFATVDSGATSLLLTSHPTKLVIGASMGSALVHVLDLSESTPQFLRTFEHHRTRDIIVGYSKPGHKTDLSDMEVIAPEVGGSTEEMDPPLASRSVSNIATTITHMTTSIDGQWLASADTRHRIHVFNFDSVQHHCVLPSFPYSIAAMAFDPLSPSTLIIGLANNTLQVFDVETRQFPQWSQMSADNTHSTLRHLHDPLLGMTFDYRDAETVDAEAEREVLLWSSSWMYKAKLGVSTRPVGTLSKKRRRDSRRLSQSAAAEGELDDHAPEAENDTDNRIITRYRPVLLAEYIGPKELVVVERPLMELLSTLPPAYFKPRYGS
ncbi:WD40 repeat-like protein [Hysterangium stoloniferum]|nr:WD40 repeat-like protein [Hysterangium stoloniferum]